MPGSGTDQQYLWLRERGLAFRPDLVMLFLQEINSVPFPLRLAFGTLDGSGSWTLSAPVPGNPNLPGAVLGLQSFSRDATGAIVGTNLGTLSFE